MTFFVSLVIDALHGLAPYLLTLFFAAVLMDLEIRRNLVWASGASVTNLWLAGNFKFFILSNLIMCLAI